MKTNWILLALLVGSAIMVVTMIIIKVTGHSPTMNALQTGLLIFLVGYTLTMGNSLSQFKGKTESTLEHHTEMIRILSTEVKDTHSELKEIKINIAKLVP